MSGLQNEKGTKQKGEKALVRKDFFFSPLSSTLTFHFLFSFQSSCGAQSEFKDGKCSK